METNIPVRVHHVIIYTFDTDGNLFELPQRWTVFRGYFGKRDRVFSRPKCNLDQDAQDTIQGSCKTDVDHTLGYLFNCLFALWRCHHSINQQFHHVRLGNESWMHGQVDEPYSSDPKGRDYPSFAGSPLKTLAEKVKETIEN